MFRKNKHICVVN